MYKRIFLEYLKDILNIIFIVFLRVDGGFSMV